MASGIKEAKFKVVELLPYTACGLSSSSTASAIRKTLTLADDISNYSFIHVSLQSTWSSVEREVSQLVVIPTYNGEKVQVGIYSDSNAGYYCMAVFTLVGDEFNIYRAYYANNTAPNLRVIGIK